MKILITGFAGSGKSLFSRYLLSHYSGIYPNYSIVDIDDFPNFNDFQAKALYSQNCFVVLQNERFFKENIKFDRVYRCSRLDDNFLITDGFLRQEFDLNDFKPYFLSDLDYLFSKA